MYFSRLARAATLLQLVQCIDACLPGIPHVHRRDESSIDRTPVVIRVAPRPTKTKTAIVNVRVFDGYTVRDPATVLIDGQQITDDATNVDHILDGQGAILLPGLIDSHCHPNDFKDLEALSSFGVTTAMSMNCMNYQQCAALRDQVGLTSFYTAGLSAAGPESAHALADGRPLYETISTPEQVPLWVHNVFSNGSDYLKITSEANGPDQATQDALVLHAHAMGRRTMTHAAGYEYYAMAIKSGSDGPQHMPYDKILEDNLLGLMISQQQFATPTTNLYKMFLQHINVLIPDAPPINHTQAYSTVQENVRRIRQRGIPILVGTDAAVGDRTVSMPFGSSLHDEMFNLVEIGFTNMEALRAATLVPALAHRLGDRGIIAPGRRADLVLLLPDANPIVNINDTRKIAKVWNGGVEYRASAAM